MENLNQNQLMYNNTEIKEIAKKSIWCFKTISLSHFLNNGNDLDVIITPNDILFSFTDNSKPYNYMEFVSDNESNVFNEGENVPIHEAKIEHKVFEDKYKKVFYKYPYYEETVPARMVEDTCGIFRTGDYTFVKEHVNRIPDYEEVERIFYKTINMFK
jgi:hypothetical protein